DYESEVRRVEESTLIDRLTWLASTARLPQVRAIASQRLAQLLTGQLRAESATEADRAHHALLAADIKRFLERPAEPGHLIPAPPAPPGAPIGDSGNDWLARPPGWWSSSR